MPERQKVILRWTDQLCINPAGTTEALREAMAEHFDDRQALTLAVYSMLAASMSKMMIVLGAEPDGATRNSDRAEPYLPTVEGVLAAVLDPEAHLGGETPKCGCPACAPRGLQRGDES